MDSAPPAHDRCAGILLHPTSLPGPYGIGDLGPEAHAFLDFLGDAGQSLWQMLPLGPPGPGNSPYSARSAFAGNELLISPDALAADGLLSSADLAAGPAGMPKRVEFKAVAAWKYVLLRRAFDRFVAAARGSDLDRFAAEHAHWLDDYALYAAIRTTDRRPWWRWPPALARHTEAGAAAGGARLASEVRFHVFTQWCFWRQWGALRARAHQQGVRIIGDIPLFVARDSADTWANRRLFKLEANGRPEVVAGVPPDVFSTTGQLWGNPPYRWDVLQQEGYAWWIARFRHTFAAFDLARVDHFRGFVAAWEVPFRARTAEAGQWVPGPGRELFDAATARLGHLPLIAEDLGVITPDVDALRVELGYPGLKVLQFAFNGDPANPYLPLNTAANSVVYTGTHDNDTTTGWAASLDARQRALVTAYTGSHAVAKGLVRLAYESAAHLAIVPMQDVLALGSEARMNVPGTPSGNWGWRYRPDQLRPEHAAFLRELTIAHGRAPQGMNAAEGG